MVDKVVEKNSVVWPAAPHTLAKHSVYRQYLSKWMPIMIHSWKGNVTYAEGYAGPGVYAGGEPGSPVIALETLIHDPDLRVKARDLRFLFVERDKRRVERLRERLAVAARPVALQDLSRYGIDLAVEAGNCDPTLIETLSKHNAWGRPMLVVLDTYGTGVNLDIVRRIAGNPSSEVIITFEPQYFVRHTEVAYGDAVFGDPEWRRVAELPSDTKAEWIARRYRKVLHDAGFPFVLTFELADGKGHSLFLVFGTTHVRGLQKMKEAMWEVDPVQGIKYRDPADPDQQLLDVELEPHTEPLRRELHRHLRQAPGHTASVGDLRRFALYQTVYKESQVKPVLDQLVEQGLATGDGGGGQLRLGGDVRLTAAGLQDRG